MHHRLYHSAIADINKVKKALIVCQIIKHKRNYRNNHQICFTDKRLQYIQLYKSNDSLKIDKQQQRTLNNSPLWLYRPNLCCKITHNITNPRQAATTFLKASQWIRMYLKTFITYNPHRFMKAVEFLIPELKFNLSLTINTCTFSYDTEMLLEIFFIQ